MMEIIEKVAAKMAKQAECNHERKATGFGYACRGHYGAYSYCLDCDRTVPLHRAPTPPLTAEEKKS